MSAMASEEAPGAGAMASEEAPGAGPRVQAAVLYDTQLRIGKIDGRGKPHRTEDVDRTRERKVVSRGLVVDFDAYEGIWRSTFQPSLSCDTLIIAEAPLTPKAQRERTLGMLFGTFGVSSVLVAVDAALSLMVFGNGHLDSSGLMLSMTHDFFDAVPVVNGIIVPHAIVHANMGCYEIVEYLIKTGLNDLSAHFEDNVVEYATAEDILLTKCVVALDYEKDREAFDDDGPCALPQYFGSEGADLDITLPDGHKTCLYELHISVCEALFKPNLMNQGESEDSANMLGVHEMVCEAISKCDSEIQPALYKSIYLTGKMTRLANLRERLQREVAALAPGEANVVVSPHGMMGWMDVPYMGACCLALTHGPVVEALSTTKEEYEENVAAVHEKVFGITKL